MEHFGEHITIDGYKGDELLLDSKAKVFSCLHDLPNLLGMHKLSKPIIYRALGNKTKDPGGWTGIVIIEESHISVHTFPKRGFLSADVYTCKNGVNTEFVVDFFKKAFSLEKVEINFLKRGLEYPAENIYK